MSTTSDFRNMYTSAYSRKSPARDTLENLGFVSQWDAESKTAVFKNADYTVSVTAGRDFFEVNGKKIVFDSAVYENNGSRPLSHSLRLCQLP